MVDTENQAGLVNPWCDYNHHKCCSRSEVRMMPSLSDGFLLLCKHHYEEERDYRSKHGLASQVWDKAPIYKTSIVNGWCDPLAVVSAEMSTMVDTEK